MEISLLKHTCVTAVWTFSQKQNNMKSSTKQERQRPREIKKVKQIKLTCQDALGCGDQHTAQKYAADPEKESIEK